MFQHFQDVKRMMLCWFYERARRPINSMSTRYAAHMGMTCWIVQAKTGTWFWNGCWAFSKKSSGVVVVIWGPQSPAKNFRDKRPPNENYHIMSRWKVGLEFEKIEPLHCCCCLFYRPWTPDVPPKISYDLVMEITTLCLDVIHEDDTLLVCQAKQ